MVTMVPDWLQGTWKRTYIRRRLPNIPPYNHDHNTGTTDNYSTKKQPPFLHSETIETDHLNNPDSTIQVRYIQTPYVFMDIRTKAKVNHTSTTTTSQEQPMAFAGVTTLFNNDDNNKNTITPLVQWHSCLDLEECQIQKIHNSNNNKHKNTTTLQYKERWIDAELNTPRFTNDVGYFQKIDIGISEDEDGHEYEHVYLEYDPDRTLLEQWVKVDDGNDTFLAVRSICGNVLIVVAGKYFGYANVIMDDNENGKNDAIFVSGIVSDCDYYDGNKWIIDTAISGSSVSVTTTMGEGGGRRGRGDFHNLEEGKILKIPRQEYKLMDGSSLPLTIIECLFEE